MSLNVISSNGSKTQINFVRWDKNGHSIICTQTDDESMEIDIDFPLDIDDSEDPDNYQIFLLAKKELNENDIYQVCLKSSDHRIGWCFPIQALNSLEHSYATNEHFLKYASVAARKLIDGCNENSCINIPNLVSNESLTFSDFFIGSIVVLVIYLPRIQPETSFVLEKSVPSLFAHGYIPLGSRHPDNIIWSVDRLQGQRITLTPISPVLEGTPFIFSAFANLVAFENNPLLSFFYIYQIVELLMEQVFIIEQEELINKLIEVKGDTVKSKDVLEKIQGITSEKKRINLLLSKYCRVSKNSNSQDLLDACNKFHKEIRGDEFQDVGEGLYQVRNVLFHQFRDVQNTATLNSIIREFAIFVITLLINFSKQEDSK